MTSSRPEYDRRVEMNDDGLIAAGVVGDQMALAAAAATSTGESLWPT
jgi:hypothetical protein